MKEKSLEQIMVEKATRSRLIVVPGSVEENWPQCLTCGESVDACDLKHVSSKGCEIVAKHHGAEDSIKVTWDIPVRDMTKDLQDDVNIGWAVKRSLRDWGAFDKSHIFDGSHRSG